MGTRPSWAIQEFFLTETPQCTSLEFQLGHVTTALIKEEIYIDNQYKVEDKKGWQEKTRFLN